jgi:hypothetical protein
MDKDEGPMTAPPTSLIARAEAVASLWDLVLFTTGQPEARSKRADVMHEAISNLRAAVKEAKGEG